jgi:pimeloyl-ACP methyl ester carboxylesterase
MAVGRAFRDDMQPWSTGVAYPNFLGEEGAARMESAFAASAERLASIKTEWDPHGVFHTHQAIRRAGAQVRTVRLPVVESGDPDGTPVVFLHGLSDSWRSFEPVLAHLPSSLRMLAVTMRGHGDAPKPEEGYGVKQLAADVVAVLDRLGVERAIVAGHSMGSIVAIRLALDAPERVAGLVLMGARPSFADLDELYAAMERFEDPVDPAFVREFQESTVARPALPGVIDTAVEESLKLPARVWQALIGPTLSVDHTAELGRIAAPTLVAWGDRDEIAGAVDQDVLGEAIPDARLVVYRGGGHAFHWEDPAAFARDLAAFVSDC